MKKIILYVIALLLLAGGLFYFYSQDGISLQQVNEDGFQAGYANQGESQGKTAVILLGGGAFADFWADRFAQAGHVGLSLPYHRREGLPDLIEEIPLEYFERAIDWLARQDAVDAKKVIVMGGSTQAELALLLAATFPEKITGVIAFSPSSVCWSNTVFPWSSEEVMSKWTLGGKDVPYVAMDKIKGNEGTHIETLPYWNAGLDDSIQVSKAAIPVERIQGPVLLLSPMDDQVWPSARMSDMIIERLDAFEFTYPYQNIPYEEAGHMMMAQYHKALTEQKGQMPIDGKMYEFDFGGTPEGNLSAQQDAREQIMKFVKRL